MQKKTKRKLNKKRFFGLLVFLAIGAIFITYLLNLKVSNVLITGTSLVSDATIIRKTNLRDYPYYKDIKKKNMENIMQQMMKLLKHFKVFCDMLYKVYGEKNESMFSYTFL